MMCTIIIKYKKKPVCVGFRYGKENVVFWIKLKFNDNSSHLKKTILIEVHLDNIKILIITFLLKSSHIYYEMHTHYV